MKVRRDLHASREVQTSLDLSYEGRILTYAFIQVQGRLASETIYDSSAARDVFVIQVPSDLAISLEPSPKIGVSVGVIEKLAVYLAFTGWGRLDQNTTMENENDAYVCGIGGVGVLARNRRNAPLF